MAPPRDTADEEYCCLARAAVERRARDRAATRASAEDVMVGVVFCFVVGVAALIV